MLHFAYGETEMMYLLGQVWLLLAASALVGGWMGWALHRLRAANEIARLRARIVSPPPDLKARIATAPPPSGGPEPRKEPEVETDTNENKGDGGAPAPDKDRISIAAPVPKPGPERPATAPQPRPAPPVTPAFRLDPNATQRMVALNEFGFPTAPVVGNDDLKEVIGIGPVIEGKLNALGIRTYRQLAALTPPQIDMIARHLGVFKERIERDNWVQQARELHQQKYSERL